MAVLSAQEQLLIELVNRARLDPAAEAARFGIGLNDGIAPGSISASAKQVLAPNELLVDAARAHSQWMIDNDVFSHTGNAGSSPFDRMAAAGYSGFSAAGENIAMQSLNGASVATAVELMHQSLFLSTSGHRQNMTDPDYRELGTGVAQGPFAFNGVDAVDSADVTENFGLRGTDTFVTGVAYDNLVAEGGDGDFFYDVGEGNAGITVEVRRGGVLLDSDVTATAGGYAVGVSAGACEVTFTGGGLAADIVCTVNTETAGGNVKVDLLGASQLLSSGNILLGANAVAVRLLGVGNLTAHGNELANVIEGNKGANVLDGQLGNDTVRGFAGADTLRGNAGVDRLVGGAGRDILTGGADRDIFDYDALGDSGRFASTRDRITDFRHLTDDIDLSTLDARTNVGGNQAFTFVGSNAFSRVSGQLHFVHQNLAGTVNDKTLVEGDVNGDAIADFQIELAGIVTLTAADFLL